MRDFFLSKKVNPPLNKIFTQKFKILVSLNSALVYLLSSRDNILSINALVPSLAETMYHRLGYQNKKMKISRGVFGVDPTDSESNPGQKNSPKVQKRFILIVTYVITNSERKFCD